MRWKETAITEIELRQKNELSPEERLTGNPRASKIDVAEHLVKNGFERLRQFVPSRPARPVLGLRPRDKYWLHMFDALALALASTTRAD